MSKPNRMLSVIIFSQFCCTSLWFAGNGVMSDLVLEFHLESTSLGHLTSAVQFGFVTGTLIFALLTIADRFPPSRVFFISALFGSLFNLFTILEHNTLISLLSFRFLTGLFLAGIYPVGMKIASDYYEFGLDKSLSLLVGALVIGTAFPHILKVFSTSLSWRFVFIVTSCLGVTGGLLMQIFVPIGPFRKPSQKLDLLAFFKVFKNREFRAASFGYFGHMWELYAFWSFIPIMLMTYISIHPDVQFDISFLSFLIIGSGGLACVIGGYLSQIIGTKKIAFIALGLSCLCCIISPLLFSLDSSFAFIGFLIFWSWVVIADSPLFSSLVAHNAMPELKGTALTIVNCVGFSITILSIQILNLLKDSIDQKFLYMILAIGPILGLLALNNKKGKPIFFKSK